MNVTPRLVIIGPEPGIRRTYNLIGFPIVIGSSDEANITLKGCGLEKQHIYLDKIGDNHIRIRRIINCSLISQRKNINDKIIADRDTFIAGKVGLQFFVPDFTTDVSTDLALEFLTSRNLGKKVIFNKKLTVGRRADTNICLPYKKVSGLHGIFSFDEFPTFTDKNSRNGSRLNGKRLKYENTVKLQAGDIIDIASHALYLRPLEYRPVQVQEKLFIFLSEYPIEKPSYDEYAPISEFSSLDKLSNNLDTDSYKDLHAKVQESAKQANVGAEEEEDLLYLGPDEDYDASDFENMLTEIQKDMKPALRQTERMPKHEEDSVHDTDVKPVEEQKKGKNILSDTYFNKIKREEIDEISEEND